MLPLILATALTLQIPAVPSQAPPPAAEHCAVSDDASYGYTKDKAVGVGGSPMYGAARQRRYLDALLGPKGEVVTYRRIGQDRAPDETIIDAYEVSHAGLEKPITLYLDWYHYSGPPSAPRGFTCGRPMNLGIPPIDPFKESEDLARLGITMGQSETLPGIPLSSGDRLHGSLFERFRLIALTAGVAKERGEAIAPEKLPEHLNRVGTVILAHPVSCGDRRVAPTTIDIVSTNGQVMPKTMQTVVERDALMRLLPGVNVPADSIAIAIGMAAPRPTDTIRLTYAGALCDQPGDAPGTVAIPTRVEQAKPIEMDLGTAPAGTTSKGPVYLQAVIDPAGRIQFPSVLGGPGDLHEAAIQTASAWRFEPVRVNGTAVPAGVLLQVRFK